MVTEVEKMINYKRVLFDYTIKGVLDNIYVQLEMIFISVVFNLVLIV